MYEPAVYELYNKRQKHIVAELMEEFADELKIMSGKCMDVGCGPGGVTKNILIPALAPDAIMIGTDISEDMVSYANEVYGDNVRLTFDMLDIQTKSLPSEHIAAYNHIFSFMALQWCSDIRQAFDNIYRMLRPGGSILILIIASHDIFDIFQTLARDNRYASYLPYSNINHNNKANKHLNEENPANLIPPLQRSTNPRKELKDLLINIGFDVQHCSLRNMFAKYEDPSIYLSLIKSITPFTKEMPNERVIQFWKDCECDYIKRKICYEEIKDNRSQMFVLDISSLLIISAKK